MISDFYSTRWRKKSPYTEREKIHIANEREKLDATQGIKNFFPL
jgi:hypothetical protein